VGKSVAVDHDLVSINVPSTPGIRLFPVRQVISARDLVCAWDQVPAWLAQRDADKDPATAVSDSDLHRLLEDAPDAE
jgi:hypothetical protein